MQEQAIHDFERGLLHVLVCAMDRVARLERDNTFPPVRDEHPARFERRVAKFWEFEIVRQVNDGHIACQIDFALFVDTCDAGMFLVGRAIDILRFARFVVLEFFRKRHHSEQMPVRFRQRDLFADIQRIRDFARDRECDRNAPDETVRESHGFDDRIVIAFADKAGERRERAGREQFEIRQVRRAKYDLLGA